MHHPSTPQIHVRLICGLMQAYPNAGIGEEDALWDASNGILEYGTGDVIFILVSDE